MFTVLATFFEIGHANGAELAFLGSPTVLLQTFLFLSGRVLLGADNSAVLVHEQFLLSETGGAIRLVCGSMKHLGARAANEFKFLAVNVIEAVL